MTKYAPIDLRSDTVTRPDRRMRTAMADAEVGDDVLEHDPTMLALEERVAEVLGMAAALWVAATLVLLPMILSTAAEAAIHR